MWGSSATDVYAVGEKGAILHYDGSEWSKMKSPILDEYLYAVWGASDSDIYAVGSAATILHYNGLTWSEMEHEITLNLRGIWGSAHNDIYAVGDEGTIIHFDGFTWSEMESGTTGYLLGVWGSSATDVYAVGGYYDGVSPWLNRDSWDGGVILHYDGNSWREIKNDVTQNLYGIWGSSDTDIYTVGSQGTILHYADSGDDDPSDEEKCVLETLYGENSENVTTLRNFRDDFLITTLQGRLVVSAYYTVSPLVVKLIINNQWLRSNLKKTIEAMLPSMGVEME